MQVTELRPDQLIKFWKQGWKSYIINPIDDYPAIISLSRECARIANEDMGTEDGQRRIGIALTAISTYCNDHHATKNLHFINRAYQTILLEMQYAKKCAKVEELIKKWNDYYDRDKRRAEENRRLMKQNEEDILRWHNESNDSNYADQYEAWKRSRGIR